jgi:hypothetical protein
MLIFASWIEMRERTTECSMMRLPATRQSASQ